MIPVAYTRHRPWRNLVKSIVLASFCILACVGIGTGILTTFEVLRLRKLGPADIAAIPYARESLHSSSPLVRAAAARALGQIGPVAFPAVPDLLECLQSDAPNVATEAAWSLGAIGLAQDDVIAALITALRHSDGEVRRYAAYSLSRLGPRAAPAIPELTSRLSDGHMAYMAARALGDIGAPAAGTIPRLSVLLSDSNWANRAEAADALSKLTPLPPEAVSSLQKLLSDPEPLVRKSAMRALRVNGYWTDGS